MFFPQPIHTFITGTFLPLNHTCSSFFVLSVSLFFLFTCFYMHGTVAKLCLVHSICTIKFCCVLCNFFPQPTSMCCCCVCLCTFLSPMASFLPTLPFVHVVFHISPAMCPMPIKFLNFYLVTLSRELHIHNLA